MRGYFKTCVISLSIIFLPNCFAETPTKCVQIYYDRVNPTYTIGRNLTIYLQNLLGHFPNIQRYIIPIEMYQPGQLDRCYASFYLGSYYENKIPQAFYQDFVNTKKNVIWMQYSIWKLSPEILQKLWMVKYNGIAGLDWKHLDAKGQPGFYRFYQYKGQEFPAFGGFDESDHKTFNANAIMIQMSPLNEEAKKNVDSWVKHSSNNQQTPFILHNGNHWYVAQIPFDWDTRESEYMIFADALFDMVGEQPRYKGKKPALVRVEDVNSGFDTPAQIMAISDVFYKYNIPFAVAVIPIFADPLKVLIKDNSGPISDNYAFLHALGYAKRHGGSFIFEGVTHQYDKLKNPFNGMTGPDYEFWNFVENKPVQEDSPTYLLERLQRGADVLAKSGIKPAAWLTPHYRASILDYVMFAQLFNWAVEDKYYVPYQVEQTEPLPSKLNFDNSWPGTVAERAPYFNSLKVSYPASTPMIIQFFPYEVYGDAYGQRVMPEDAGYITPRPNVTVKNIETVDDMIRIVKRDSVLRDVWASFFIHPVLLNTLDKDGLAKSKGDTSEIERLLVAIKAAGYQFVDINTWTKDHMEMAPKTQEITENNNKGELNVKK